MAFQTVAHTTNPLQVHALSWTVENFTKLSDSLTGPTFDLSRGGAKRFHFDLSVQDYDESLSNTFTLEVNLNIRDETKMNETTTRSSWYSASVECDIKLCTVNGKILTNAKTDFTKVNRDTALKRRVIITFFRKTAQKAEFFVFREDNKLVDLCDDKLILKATFSISGYDKGSSISSSTINKSESSHDELVKNFKSMFESGLAHDLTFSVGGRAIPAHKAIVCSRSPVFCKMLEHDMIEKRSTNVIIEDADFTTFNNFLLFLYTGEILQKDWESVLGIYSLADKYQVDSLRKECSAILSASLAVSSFCRIVVLADLHSDLELVEASKVFFKGNFSRVIETGEWAQLVVSKPEFASMILGSMKASSTT